MEVDGRSCAAPTEPPPPFVSFAQNFEDVMLWRALGHVSGGFYIDIGAGEPEADSVTKAFYDRGWSGINVEPAEGPFARVAAARPRDRNLRLLVGDGEGAREFFLIDGGNALSTAIPELAARHAAAGWAAQAITVPTTTLATICEQHVQGQIHFLKLDAEWSELAILRGADFARFRPWVVLFEATPIGTGPHSYVDCDRVLEQAGYRFVYADGLNRFWVAEERHADLARHFAVAPNVFDSFVRASEIAAQTQAAAARDDFARAAAGLDECRHLLAQQRDEAAAAQAALAQAHARLAEAAQQQAHELAQAHAAEAAAQAALAEARADADDRRRQRDEARADLASLRDELAGARAALAEQAGQQAAQLARAAAEAEATVAALRTRLDHSVAERDAYTQELFETNRHAAQLTIERQQLLERVASATEQLAHARAHGDYLKSWLDAVYASTSWKFARPVRLAHRLLGKRS